MEINPQDYDLEMPVATHVVTETSVSSLGYQSTQINIASAFGNSATFDGVLVGSVSNTVSISTTTQHLDISFQTDEKTVKIKGQLDVTIDGEPTQLDPEKLTALEVFLSNLVSGANE